MMYMYDKATLTSLILYSSFKLENSILVLGMGLKKPRKIILSKYRTSTLLKVPKRFQFTYIQINSKLTF